MEKGRRHKRGDNMTDLLCDIGSDFFRELTITDIDDLPVDLTGASAEMNVRDLSDNLLVDVTCTVTDPTNGVLTLTIAKSDTQDIDLTGLELRNISEVIDDIGTKTTETAYHAVYSCELTYADNTTEQILRGKFGLIPERTHA